MCPPTRRGLNHFLLPGIRMTMLMTAMPMPQEYPIAGACAEDEDARFTTVTRCQCERIGKDGTARCEQPEGDQQSRDPSGATHVSMVGRA